MGIWSECMEANYMGVPIEVEAKLGVKDNWKGGVVQYRLVIDNKIVQEEMAHVGKTMLRGFIESQSGRKDQIRVIINQGWFKTNYTLEINGQGHNLRKKY